MVSVVYEVFEVRGCTAHAYVIRSASCRGDCEEGIELPRLADRLVLITGI